MRNIGLKTIQRGFLARMGYRRGAKNFKDNFYIIYNLDFDLVSDDIGHDQCTRGHIDLDAAEFGVNPFHKDSPCGRRFDQIIAHATAIDNQDNNLPDEIDDSSVSDWYAGFDLGQTLDPSRRLMVDQQPDLMEELLDDCLQILSADDSPAIKTAEVSTQTEPEQIAQSRKSRKFMKRMKGGIDRVLFKAIQSYMSPGFQHFLQDTICQRKFRNYKLSLFSHKYKCVQRVDKYRMWFRLFRHQL